MVPGSSGLKAGFGPSTPASLISPRGEFSNPPGGTRENDGAPRAAPFLVCRGCRRNRTADTRVTNFPAGGSFRIRPGAPEEYRARYRYGAGLFWSKGRIRTVGTRVTHFPAGGGSFRIRPGAAEIDRARYTATVPGSSGSCHVKNEAPACWGSKQAPVSEYVCGESRNERWGGD